MMANQHSNVGIPLQNMLVRPCSRFCICLFGDTVIRTLFHRLSMDDAFLPFLQNPNDIRNRPHIRLLYLRVPPNDTQYFYTKMIPVFKTIIEIFASQQKRLQIIFNKAIIVRAQRYSLAELRQPEQSPTQISPLSRLESEFRQFVTGFFLGYNLGNRQNVTSGSLGQYLGYHFTSNEPTRVLGHPRVGQTDSSAGFLDFPFIGFFTHIGLISLEPYFGCTCLISERLQGDQDHDPCRRG